MRAPRCPYVLTHPFPTRSSSDRCRLSGLAFGGKLNWAVGCYMDEQRPGVPAENATINVAILQRAVVNDLTTKSRAVYCSLEYAITDNLKINGGLRYTHEDRKSVV